jgi:hypothetical protein
MAINACNVGIAQTTIQIRTATRDRLKDLGTKGQSYDTVINRIIDLYAEVKAVVLPTDTKLVKDDFGLPYTDIPNLPNISQIPDITGILDEDEEIKP